MDIPVMQKQPVLPLLVVLVVLTVVSLTTLAVWLKRPDIETDLLQRTRQALAVANLPLDNVRFEGRDGVLAGEVGETVDTARMLEAASHVAGVRSMTNYLEIAPALPKPAVPVAAEGGTLPEAPAVFKDGLFVPQKTHLVEQIDLHNIQFEYSKFDLKAEAFPILEQVISELQKKPTQKVEISAHTDSSGTALGNMAVTQARAEAVKDYLVSKGVDAGRLRAVGYGSTRPLASNETEQGREQNRRIEITVVQE